MTNDQPTIPMPIASHKDRLARFALQQMEVSGLVEKEATQTQPFGHAVLTMDKAMAAALFRFERHALSELWVLGDLAGLEAIPEGEPGGMTNRSSRRSARGAARSQTCTDTE